tara:strand:- start:1149 stop:2372 length:1224 start_codon:yes stop_codon:yes gene_type:complete
MTQMNAYGLIGLTEENVGVDRRFYTGLTSTNGTFAVSYNAGRVDVFLNGIKLVGNHTGNANYDYTMDSTTGTGSTITLATGVALVSADVIECVGYVSNSSNTVTSYNPTPTSGDGGFNEFRNITHTASDLVNVFLNGVLLDDSDYTLAPSTNGGTVTIGSPTITASDVVVIQVIGALDHSNFVPASGGTFSGNVAFGGTVDLQGNELILDADNDTTITSDTDDQIDIKIGGSDKASIISTGLLIDDINEKTSAHGVEIDGVTLKDSSVMIQSGGSIQFHPHGSSPSNSLDDYEEGTFNFTLGGGLHSSGTANGHYVKIGSYVSISGRFYYPNGSNSTITGLPFAVKNGVGSRGGGVIVYQDLDGTARSILGDLNQTQATIYNFQQGAVDYTASDKQYFFIFSYFTDA